MILHYRSPVRISSALLLVLAMLSGCQEDDPIENPKSAADDCITKPSGLHGKVIPGEYIVSFSNRSATGRQSSARTFARHSIPQQNVAGETQGARLHYFVKLSPDEAAALRNDPDVASVEPDRVISINACFMVEDTKLLTWNVRRVGYGDGTGKTAWVLDTGLDFTHPDLVVDRNRSKSFVEGNTSAKDDNGHGTHIGGIIGAKNNRIGMLGVASGATLIALKILDHNGDGKLSYALKALSHVQTFGKRGDALNLSMSLEDVSEALETEIQAVANRGVFVSIAAGNESRQASLASPARTAGLNIYTVSAVDSLNRFAPFSNFGNDAVDFAAPGVRIPSSYLNGSYAYMSGTSMAAPHVTGILLLNDGKVNRSGYALEDPDQEPDALAHR